MEKVIELKRSSIPDLLNEAFGKHAEGVMAAEDYLNGIPHGGKYPRRLMAFAGYGEGSHPVKQDLIGMILAKREPVMS